MGLYSDDAPPLEIMKSPVGRLLADAQMLSNRYFFLWTVFECVYEEVRVFEREQLQQRSCLSLHVIYSHAK